ncbi:MAG: endolytic transglycosylase MltG [Chloroflexi bacterium]|nr:endolytic transglycosylase MltG [Chloroflexota bacterium]
MRILPPRRALPFIAVFLTLVMTGLAIWQITESPGAVPDVRPGLSPSPSPGEAVAITIKPGQNPSEIGDLLQEQGVIDSAIQFRVLVALLGYDKMLQAGDYEFDAGTPALTAVYRMRRGVISSRFVTVVEGWRLEQIADALAEKGISREEFLAGALADGYDFEFLSDLEAGQPLEGYLFPATYYFRRSDTAADIVARMLQAFDQNVTPELRGEAGRAGLTLAEVVTLASIIEREAQVGSERPIMAQVFLKRIRLGIPLEADPTVQYAVASDATSVQRYGYWKQELTTADLEVDSPYNTYRYYGLPPGPIANPGLDSITAVIRPAKTNYLYFVAKPDGSHAFAETFQEHQENVKKYRGGSE